MSRLTPWGGVLWGRRTLHIGEPLLEACMKPCSRTLIWVISGLRRDRRRKASRGGICVVSVVKDGGYRCRRLLGLFLACEGTTRVSITLVDWVQLLRSYEHEA